MRKIFLQNVLNVLWNVYHQTGANFIKDGRMYHVPRRFQIMQAQKAGIDYKIVNGFLPESKKTI